MVFIYLALAAFIWCVTVLTIMLINTARKFQPELSESRGKPFDGIMYAFTKGMLPNAKESASQHQLSYYAGILFHLGIFTAFATGPISYFLTLPCPHRIPHVWLYPMTALLAIGTISGLGLLIKRILVRRMRIISSIDDYFSNIIVNIFQILALLYLLAEINYTFHSYWLFATFLLTYIPLGNLRHCAYFFATRVMFGYFYGRRGVLPHQNKFQ